MTEFEKVLISFYESLRPERLYSYEEVMGPAAAQPLLPSDAVGKAGLTSWEAVLGSWANVDLRGAEAALEPMRPDRLKDWDEIPGTNSGAPR